jgi:hypothetical protein
MISSVLSALELALFITSGIRFGWAKAGLTLLAIVGMMLADLFLIDILSNFMGGYTLGVSLTAILSGLIVLFYPWVWLNNKYGKNRRGTLDAPR